MEVLWRLDDEYEVRPIGGRGSKAEVEKAVPGVISGHVWEWSKQMRMAWLKVEIPIVFGCRCGTEGYKKMAWRATILFFLAGCKITVSIIILQDALDANEEVSWSPYKRHYDWSLIGLTGESDNNYIPSRPGRFPVINWSKRWGRGSSSPTSAIKPLIYSNCTQMRC